MYICTIYLLEHGTWKYKKKLREYAATIRHMYLKWQAHWRVQFKRQFYPAEKTKAAVTHSKNSKKVPVKTSAKESEVLEKILPQQKKDDVNAR